MKLSKLTDDQLLRETKKSAKIEKQALISLLYHLLEVDHRRLYSKLKYPSMLEYVVKELGYSEPEAIRRISAMRLMRDVPEIQGKVNSGVLNMTNMVLAQAMFSKERKAGRKYSRKQKIEVLEKLENKSTRQAQAIVKQICPEMGKKREQSFDDVEDESLREKLLRLKGMLAHSHPDITLNQLQHMIVDEAFASRLPAAPKVKPEALTLPKSNDGYIPRSIRYLVFFRDLYKCTNCDSVHALQIDHIIPKAKGGKSTPENLRLLCRACNQRAAIEEFGAEKMASHLNLEYQN